MGDWKRDLGKHASYSGGGSSVKKCEKCGKPLKDDKFKLCFSCNEAMKSGGGGISSNSAKLRDDYLTDGYFEEKNGKNYIKEEVFIKWAQEVSGDLKLQTPAMTSAAIRRYFSKLRAIEYKYKMNHDFDLAREGIYAFVRDVSYTENRSVTPVLFSRFIEKNVTEAKKSPEHFRAFVEHFQSVVAYFKDK